jgi:hypothetical protein
LKSEFVRAKGPSKTGLNKLIIDDPAVWKAVLVEFGLAANLTMPVFPEDYLYGSLSDRMHNPSLSSVFLSDLADEKYKFFFKEIAVKVCQREFAEFVEEDTVDGEDIDKKLDIRS